MFRRLRSRVLPVIALAGSFAGGWAAWEHQRYKHLAVHEPGMMYRAAWLEPGPLANVIERHQIRSVVNLCAAGEMGEDRWSAQREAVKNAGARLFELPMPTGVEATEPEIEKHLEALSNPDNYPMLVHCQHGVTRTAKFLAIYDIAFRNRTADETFAAQPKFGREDHNVNVKAFVRDFETRHQRLYPGATADKLDVLKR